MEGSIQRVETLLAGGKPDRGIFYDKILNDAVIEYYGGEKITEESKRRVVVKAMREALDASNGLAVPVLKDYEDLYYGRKVIHQRWTKWVGPRSYPDLDTYVKRKREEFNAGNLWTKDDLAAIPAYLAHNRELQEELRPTFWSWGSVADVGFMGFYTEVGLEQFSYYFADYPQLYQELLDYNVTKSILKFENLPEDHGIKLMHMGDDIAFKSGTIMPVDYMKKEYFPRLKKTIAASHKQGIKQIFHSDGERHEYPGWPG